MSAIACPRVAGTSGGESARPQTVRRDRGSIKALSRHTHNISNCSLVPMLGAQSGTSEREWECEVVLCESEMSEEEDIAAVMGVLWLW